MAGIYGYVTDGKKDIALDGRQMIQSDKDVISEVKRGDGFLSGCVSHKYYENNVGDIDGFVLSFYGEIFGVLGDDSYAEQDVLIKNAKELWALLSGFCKDGDNLSQVLDKVVQLLNGAFIISLFDKEAKSLTIYNDRFGLYPLFYARTADGFFFSQEAKIFKDVLDLMPDYTGIAEYLTFDYCLEDRTFFKDVKYILPAQKICYKDGNVETEIYWERHVKVGKNEKSKSVYIKELHDIYEKAVKTRRSKEADIISLTGGFDSRLILAVLGGEKAHTYNFGNIGSDDQIGASALAEAYDTDHHYMEFSRIDYMQNARDIVWMTDGQCPFERFYVLETAKIKAQIGEVLR